MMDWIKAGWNYIYTLNSQADGDEGMLESVRRNCPPSTYEPGSMSVLARHRNSLCPKEHVEAENALHLLAVYDLQIPRERPRALG